MNTAHKAPVIAQTDTVILGGGLQALFSALEESGERRVLLVSQATMLPEDICLAGRYDLTVTPERHPLWRALTAPARTPTGALHPDRLKLSAEALCEKAGVQLLYSCYPLGRTPTALTVAGKFGLALIKASRVLDMRERKTAKNRYIVQVERCDAAVGSWVQAGEYRAQVLAGCEENHRLLAFEMNDAEESYACRFHALEGFRAFRKLQGWQDVVLGRFSLQGYLEDGAPLLLPPPGKAVLSAAEYPCQGHPLPADCFAVNPLAQQLYSEFACPTAALPRQKETEVLIVGGGTTGLPAALAAAEEGAATLLVEMNPGWGGTGTLGGVSAYWFGKRLQETARIDQKVLELSAGISKETQKGFWGPCDVFHPDIKEQALARLCRGAGVETCEKQIAFAATRQAGRITGVWLAGERGVQRVCAAQVVDATGDGDIAAFCGVPFTYGSERDGFSYWASLAQYKDCYRYQNNFAGMVRIDDAIDYTRFLRHARQRGAPTFDHGVYLAPRETRHIKGRQTVSLLDLCTFRNYADCICTCFSNYDPKGRTDSSVIYAGVLPLQNAAAIPLGSVQPEGIEGLWVGGKAISCTHNALPSLRMQPDLQRLGAALGTLAACTVTRSWAKPDCRALARRTNDPLRVPRQPNRTLRQWVADFCAAPRTQWMDLSFAQEQMEMTPAIAIMSAAENEAVPALLEQYRVQQDACLKAKLAAMLLFFGHGEGAAWLADHLEKQLAHTLPLRRESLMCVQMLPDHGVMAEEAYLLCMLGRSPSDVNMMPAFTALCDRLEENPRDWCDNQAAIFPYFDAIAYAAEQSGRQEFVVLLHRLAALPELSQSYPAADLRSERMEMIKLILWRTLWLLGDKEAERVLHRMSTSELAQIAVAARMALAEKGLPAHTNRW